MEGRRTRRLIAQAFALFLNTLTVLSAYATVGQGFGIRNVVDVRGTGVNIHTGNPPGTSLPGTYNVGLTGICANFPCSPGSYLFETGWYKGASTLNQLKHYVSWVGPNSSGYKTDLGNLNSSSWYEFQTLFSNTTNMWEAWRNGVPRYQIFLGDSFKMGNYVACGLEAGLLGTAYPSYTNDCIQMKYKVGSGSWTLHEYAASQIAGPYCITRFTNYEVYSWKCS
jgi:hypothetical protein